MIPVGAAAEARSSYLASRLPENESGLVQSVFQSSLNLAFGEMLVHIGCPPLPLSSFGIRLTPERLQPLLRCCRQGDLVRLRDGCFWIYTTEQPIVLEFDSLPQQDLRLPQPPIARQEIPGSAVFSCLQEMPFAARIGIPWDERTGKYTHSMAQGTFLKNPKAIEQVLRYFLGRGKGLTPGGDDLLLGYTLARRLFLSQDAWVKRWQECDWSKTTPVSRAYSRALAEGFASEDWLELTSKLGSKDKNEILPLLLKICGTGHTSGYDLLYGFYLGLLSLIK